MMLAFVKEGESGVLFCSNVSRQFAISQRRISGDLLFDDDGTIDQGQDWLFEWELNDATCYARRMQNQKLNVKGYAWSVSVEGHNLARK